MSSSSSASDRATGSDSLGGGKSASTDTKAACSSGFSALLKDNANDVWSSAGVSAPATIAACRTSSGTAPASFAIFANAFWCNSPDSARRAEAIIVEGETSASNVIKHYAPLLEAERHVQKWMPAQHLIEKIGPLLTGDESHRLIDVVIDHIRLMVGDATPQIESFKFLADDVSEQNSSLEFFRLIVWLCNHPQSLSFAREIKFESLFSHHFRTSRLFAQERERFNRCATRFFAIEDKVRAENF